MAERITGGVRDKRIAAKLAKQEKTTTKKVYSPKKKEDPAPEYETKEE